MQRESEAGRVGWGAPLAVFVLALLVLGVPTVRQDGPLDEASAEHLNGARSLASGLGFRTRAVGHHLVPVTALPAPSHTRAMPLTSVAHAPFVASGDGRARVSVVLWGALAAGLVCLFAGGVLRSRGLGAACGVAFACLPPLQRYGTTSDASVIYVAVTLGACLLYARTAADLEAKAPAVGLGVLIGLGALTQPEAIASIPLACLVTACVARWRGLIAPTRRQWALAASAALVVVLPWSIRCLVEFGTPWSPTFGPALASSSTADALRREHPPTWAAFAERLAADPGRVWRSGVEVVAGVSRTYVAGLGSWVLAGVTALGTGLLMWRRGPGRALALLALAHVALFGAVEAALGSPARTLVVAAPVILVATAAPLGWLIERYGSRSRVAARLDGLALAAAGVCALGLLVQFATKRPSPSLRAELEWVERFLIQGNAPPEMPMITDRPHLYHWVTGRPSLVLTSDGIPANLRLARAFTTKLVLLRPAGIAAPAFEDLAETYDGSRPHRAFDHVLQRGELKLYRVHPRRGEDD